MKGEEAGCPVLQNRWVPIVNRTPRPHHWLQPPASRERKAKKQKQGAQPHPKEAAEGSTRGKPQPHTRGARATTTTRPGTRADKSVQTGRQKATAKANERRTGASSREGAEQRGEGRAGKGAGQGGPHVGGPGRADRVGKARGPREGRLIKPEEGREGRRGEAHDLHVSQEGKGERGKGEALRESAQAGPGQRREQRANGKGGKGAAGREGNAGGKGRRARARQGSNGGTATTRP